MGLEYKIKCTIPAGYDPAVLLRKLPSPINPSPMAEIYNYWIEEDGFHFVDNLVNEGVAAIAFKRFVNEALRLSDSVEIIEP